MFASKTTPLNHTCPVSGPDLFDFSRVACLEMAGFFCHLPAGESRQ